MQTKKRARPVKFGKPAKKEEVKVDKLAAKEAAEADMHSPETEELKKILEERIHSKDDENPEHTPNTEEEPMEVKLSEEVPDEEEEDADSKLIIDEEPKESESDEATEEVEDDTTTKEQADEPKEESKEEPEEEPTKPSPYGSFTNDDREEKKKTTNYLSLFLLVAGITFVVGLAFIAGISYTMSLSNKKPLTLPSFQQGSATPTEQPATPTPEKMDLSAYSIKVLNGSGTTGEAAKAKDTLVGAGFTVSSVGNAATSDYTLTVITAKKNVSEAYLNKLTDALKKVYSVNSVVEEAPTSQTIDVIVTVGSQAAK